ncbi:MAG: hypothetical protein DRN68_07875, partial [Thaumarchaeota archaeon]
RLLLLIPVLIGVTLLIFTITQLFSPEERKEIYYELQKIYFEDCPSVMLYQPVGRHYERDWVQGWYYNPIYPGVYFYALWKGY